MTDTERSYSRWQRIRLFIRDYIDEFGIAWSLARTNDCERSGGHYWKAPAHDPSLGNDWWCECSKCGCSQSLPVSESVATGTVTIYPATTNVTGGRSS